MPLAQPRMAMVDFDFDAMVCDGGLLDNLIDPLSGGAARYWFGPTKKLVQYGADEPLQQFDPITGDTIGLQGHTGWVNDCLHGRDLTQAAWVKTGASFGIVARDATGADGTANGASRIKCTTPNKAVTGAVNNGSGLVRLTVVGHGLPTDTLVHVEDVGGVTGAGGTAGGKFLMTSVDADHIDLQGSTFGGTYTSGGIVAPTIQVVQSITDATSRPHVIAAMIKLGDLCPKISSANSGRIQVTTDGVTWQSWSTSSASTQLVTSQHMFELMEIGKDSGTNPVIGFRVAGFDYELIIDFVERQQDRTFVAGLSPAAGSPVTVPASQLLVSNAGYLIKAWHSIAAESYATHPTALALPISSAHHARVWNYQFDAGNLSDCTTIGQTTNMQTRYRVGGTTNRIAQNSTFNRERRQGWGLAAASNDFRSQKDGAQTGAVTTGSSWAAQDSGAIEIARNIAVARFRVWVGAASAANQNTETFMGARAGYDLAARLGYTKRVWFRDFGSAKTGPDAITNLTELFHPGKGGFWPRMEDGTANFGIRDYLGGNAELQRYRDNVGLVSPPGSAWSDPLHEITPTSLKLWARLNPAFTRDTQLGKIVVPDVDPKNITNVADNGSGLYRITVPGHGFGGALPQQRVSINLPGTNAVDGIRQITVIDADTFDIVSPGFVAGWTSGGTVQRYWDIGLGKTVNIRIGAGQDIVVGGRYQVWAVYGDGSGFGNNAPGTITQYANDTVVFVVDASNPTYTAGGLQGMLQMAPLAYESAMITTRSGLYTDHKGWWRLRMKSPFGIGHWPAAWFIRASDWPPEIDLWEGFFETQTEKNTRNVGFISNPQDTRSLNQPSRTYSDYLQATGSGRTEISSNILGTRNLTDNFTNFEMEFAADHLVMAHDGKEAWARPYKWMHERSGAWGPAGTIQDRAFLEVNYAIGPPATVYYPRLVSQFPQCIDCDYFELLVKEC